MKKIIILLSLLLVSCVSTGFSNTEHQKVEEKTTKYGKTERGIASHYAVRTNGRTTASGIPLDDNKLTAASVIFPLNSKVEVTNLNNGKTVVVKITDTGPFAVCGKGRAIRPLRRHPTRIIDMSQASAKALGFVKNGITRVEVKRIVEK